MKRKFLVPILMLAILLTACAYNASLVKTSYDILMVAQTSYDTSMKMIASLDKQGLLDPEDKVRVLAAGHIYHQAHNSAVESLVIYKETGSATDRELLEKQITLVSNAIADLLTIIRPFLED